MALSGLQEIHERLDLIDHEQKAQVVYQIKPPVFLVNHEIASSKLLVQRPFGTLQN